MRKTCSETHVLAALRESVLYSKRTQEHPTFIVNLASPHTLDLRQSHSFSQDLERGWKCKCHTAAQRAVTCCQRHHRCNFGANGMTDTLVMESRRLNLNEIPCMYAYNHIVITKIYLCRVLVQSSCRDEHALRFKHVQALSPKNDFFTYSPTFKKPYTQAVVRLQRFLERVVLWSLSFLGNEHFLKYPVFSFIKTLPIGIRLILTNRRTSFVKALASTVSFTRLLL